MKEVFAAGREAASPLPNIDSILREIESETGTNSSHLYRTTGQNCMHISTTQSGFTCYNDHQICYGCAVISYLVFTKPLCPFCFSLIKKSSIGDILSLLIRVTGWEVPQKLICDGCSQIRQIDTFAESLEIDSPYLHCSDCFPLFKPKAGLIEKGCMQPYDSPNRRVNQDTSDPEPLARDESQGHRITQPSGSPKGIIKPDMPVSEPQAAEEGKTSEVEEIRCKQCSQVKEISAFRYYLYGTHNCLICDDCYKQRPVTAMGDFCKLCTLFNYSLTVCDEMGLVIFQKGTPEISCSSCRQRQNIECYRVSQRLSHWWRCKVCDTCLERVCRGSLPSRCTYCKVAYSSKDIAAIQWIFQPVEEPFACLVCERVQPNSKFALIRKCKHYCQICEDCLLLSQKSSCSSTKCPECKVDFGPEARNWIVQAEIATKIKEEMRAVCRCQKCGKEKLGFDIRKSNKLHHECVICDQCWSKNGVTRRCGVCLTMYNEHDRRFIEKVLTDVRASPQPASISASPKCPCGSKIHRNEPHCSRKCLCFLCLFQHVLLTKRPECPTCGQRIVALGSILPSEVECSGCLRKLPTSVVSPRQICGVCPNRCVMCFFCVQFDKQNRAICRNCSIPIERVNVEEVQRRQQSFDLGCYCGDQGGYDEELPCTHKVHSRCLPTLYACRICNRGLKLRPRYKTLSSILPSFSK